MGINAVVITVVIAVAINAVTAVLAAVRAAERVTARVTVRVRLRAVTAVSFFAAIRLELERQALLPVAAIPPVRPFLRATHIMPVNTVYTVEVFAAFVTYKIKGRLFLPPLIFNRLAGIEACAVAHTYPMEKLKRTYRYLRKKYELLTFKRYTTLAGTLVFFLIMSIVPLAFWLTLLVGKLPIDFSKVTRLPVFDSIKGVLSRIRREALNATASVSVVLLFTTLYSSTNLFYQMRKSGEIIYDYHRKRQGLRLRLAAFLLLLITLAMAVAFLMTFALGAFLFAKIFSARWATLADYALLIAMSFGLVLLLNAYVCPFKTKVRYFLGGTSLTVGAWVVAVIGFSVYLRFSNVTRLYGALSTLIVFLLWLYALTICFVAGVIFNSERVLKMQKNKRKRKE